MDLITPRTLAAASLEVGLTEDKREFKHRGQKFKGPQLRTGSRLSNNDVVACGLDNLSELKFTNDFAVLLCQESSLK